MSAPSPVLRDGTGRLLDKRLAQRSEGRSSIPGREAQQSLKHLPCDERVAGRGVTIVRDDAESLAQTHQRELRIGGRPANAPSRSSSNARSIVSRLRLSICTPQWRS